MTISAKVVNVIVLIILHVIGLPLSYTQQCITDSTVRRVPDGHVGAVSPYHLLIASNNL